MSAELTRLIEQWEIERPILKTISDRMIKQTEIMANLNARIFKLCKEENINIKDALKAN